MIELNRQQRIKIAQRKYEEQEEARNIEEIMKNIGKKSGPQRQLQEMEEDLERRLRSEVTKKQLEEEGLLKFKEVDEEIADFCLQIRKDMAWTDAQSARLGQKDIQVIFGRLAERHEKSMENIRKMIDDLFKNEILLSPVDAKKFLANTDDDP